MEGFKVVGVTVVFRSLEFLRTLKCIAFREVRATTHLNTFKEFRGYKHCSGYNQYVHCSRDECIQH